MRQTLSPEACLTRWSECAMQENYWVRTLEGRLTRRRALIGASATAAAAAFLAACGGGSDGGSQATGKPKSELVTESKDTTAQATRGGALRSYLTSDIPSLDPSAASFPLNFVAGFTYGTLINEKPGHLGPPQAELYGDLAESWEESPDRLTI